MQHLQFNCLAGRSAGLLFFERYVVKWHDLHTTEFTILYSNSENPVFRADRRSRIAGDALIETCRPPSSMIGHEIAIRSPDAAPVNPIRVF